jgi:hypothetical protein
MDPETAKLLTELVEKVGLLRSDLKKKQDYEKYEARVARVEQKLSALAEYISRTDAELAKRLRTAMRNPGISLAFRNRDHQNELKRETNEDADEEQSSE